MNSHVRAHLLIVEDNTDLSRMLEQNLGFEGFRVQVAPSGEEALRLQEARGADLIVLDLMLPGLDGFGVLQRLRGRGDRVPVLMLTARGEEEDRVRGLVLGADDYLVKPFSMLEFIERVKAILRRTLLATPKALLSGPLRADTRAMVVFREDAEVELTAKEYRILEVLLTHAPATLSRRELLQRAWEPDAWPTPRTVDCHIARLRRKLGDDDSCGWILTIGGEGYRWTLPVTTE